MGLDLIPKPYPCRLDGRKPVTVRCEDGKEAISCKKTVEAGMCPFHDATHCIGILGARCWYRGKLLAYALEGAGRSDLADMLYGEGEEQIVYVDGFLSAFDGANVLESGIETETRADIEEGVAWLRRMQKLDCSVVAWY